MFQLSLLEVIILNRINLSYDLNGLLTITDFIISNPIDCLDEFDFQKFMLLAIFLKAKWISFCLDYTNSACKTTFNNEIGSQLKEIALFIIDEISLSFKILNDFKVVCDDSKLIQNQLSNFENNLKMIENLVHNGVENPWEVHLKHFNDQTDELKQVLQLIQPSLLQQCIKISSDKSDQENLHFFRKLKFMVSNQIQCKKDLNKLHHFNYSDTDLFDKLEKVNSNFIKNNKVEAIQRSFENCRKIQKLINLQFKICDKCVNSDNNEGVDLDYESASDPLTTLPQSECDYPITSTPIKMHKSNSSTSTGSTETDSKSSDFISLQNFFNLETKLTEDDSTPVVLPDVHQPKIVAKGIPSKKRHYWTEEETYLIFKGKKQNLSWKSIKKHYFANSFRTNVNIRDRWTNIVKNQCLMTEFAVRYEEEINK